MMRRMSGSTRPAWVLAGIGGAGMAVSQWLVFAFAPLEAEMKLVQKIFYIHLPMSWWALFSFFVVFIAGIASLRSRGTFWEHLADSAAESGVVLAFLSLATGSVWARAAWWTWWKWDYRLTTTLVMWLVYAAYLVLRGLPMRRRRRARIKAVAGILAFLDVPLVFFAARLWESSHPAGIMAARDGLEVEMRIAVMAALLSFGCIWYAMIALRFSLLRMEEELENRHGGHIGRKGGNHPRGEA